MTQQTERCLKCDAAMPLLSGIRHCRCAYCGSKFAVDWSDQDTPILTRFEDILAVGDGGDVALAAQRTEAIEAAVAQAEQEVEARQEQLRRSQSAYRSELQAFGEAIQGPQAWTLAAGLLAAVTWFLVTFVLENLSWYLGLVAAVLLSLLAREMHRRWQATEQRMRARMPELSRAIEQAQAGVQEAQAHREDACLERELWQAKASNQRVLPTS